MAPRHRGRVWRISPTLGLICGPVADPAEEDALERTLLEFAATAEDAAVRAWIEELREVMARGAGTGPKGSC